MRASYCCITTALTPARHHPRPPGRWGSVAGLNVPESRHRPSSIAATVRGEQTVRSNTSRPLSASLAVYAKCMQKSDDGVDSRALGGLNGL